MTVIYSLFRTSAAEHVKYMKHKKHTVFKKRSKKAKNYTTEQSDKDTIYIFCVTQTIYTFAIKHSINAKII